MKIRKKSTELRVALLWKTIKREWDKIDAGGGGGKHTVKD
jgi:hypothetical protein